MNYKEIAFWLFFAVIIFGSDITNSYVKSLLGKTPEEYGQESVKWLKIKLNKESKQK